MAVVQTFLIAFPSSYLVERGFSAVINLLTKKRQRLQITNRKCINFTMMCVFLFFFFCVRKLENYFEFQIYKNFSF